MTTTSLKLKRFRAFLNLEAERSFGRYAAHLGFSYSEFEDWGEQGHFPQLTQCADYARDNLFSLADSCLTQFYSISGSPAEFLAMERILIEHAQKQIEATKCALRLEEAPSFTRFGIDIGMDDAADLIFETHSVELNLWLDKERLDYQDAAGAVSRQSDRSVSLRSKHWPDWIAELVCYFHEEGFPPGEGSQGQEAIINEVAQRLAKRELGSPSRAAVQPMVQAVLDRWRAAKK
jgi:hypothetical protein